MFASYPKQLRNIGGSHNSCSVSTTHPLQLSLLGIVFNRQQRFSHQFLLLNRLHLPQNRHHKDEETTFNFLSAWIQNN